MGHTLATITGQFDQFRSQFSTFRRALRRSDQHDFDLLLDEARQHLPAASNASHVLPDITILLCLVLEKHKQARRHETDFEVLRMEFREGLDKLRNELLFEIRKLHLDLLLIAGDLDHVEPPPD